MENYLISSEQAPINEQVWSLFNEIKESGFESRPRDFLCREIYFKQMAIDPLHPIMDYNGRRFPYYYLAGELAWYLSMDRDPGYILEFSKFWEALRNDDGTVNSNYGNLLFPEQLRLAKDEIINDINTRRGVAFISKPEFQLNDARDFVCSMYLNFFVRENTLHMALKIRSNDIIYGLTYDAPFFSFVLQHMYMWLRDEKYPDLKLGTYFHFADNIHYYERHFDMVDRILGNVPEKGPKFELVKPMFGYVDGKFKLSETVDEFIWLAKEIRRTDGTKEDYIALMDPWIKITVT